MQISRMTKEEFKFWMTRSTSAYAKDKKIANGYSDEEAQKIAKLDFDRLLPNGLDTKDSYLFTAKNKAAEWLGFLWFNVKGEGRAKRAFIYDIIIEDKYRGQGHGKKLMLLLEDELKKIHVNRVGLHVFGFNERAINLYKSLGYTVTDLQMEKKI